MATKKEGIFDIPSYEKVRETLIPDKKKITKDFIDKELLDISSLCVNMDIWSSKSMNGYLGISVSGIKSDFSCFKAYLACKHLTERHTGPVILKVYEEVMQLWGIHSKVIHNNNSIIKIKH